MLPASNLDGLLCAFDQFNTYFAVGTPDGRIRTFDTVTGRLRSALQISVGPLCSKNPSGALTGHLAEGHSCLVWLSSQVSSPKAPTGPFRSWVAVGTGSGAVKCYDSATGELQWQSNSCNEGGVECLAYSPSRSSVLLSSGKDGQVSSLDVASGSRRAQFKASKHGVAAAALSADGQKLILGGSTLSLWDMTSQQRIAKFTGHPLPVRVLAFAPSSAFALSAAEGERLVAVWPTPDTGIAGKTRNKGVAAASLAVKQPVVGLATAAAESEGPGCFYAAATTSGGEAYCWLIRPEGHSTVSSTQLVRVAVGDPASSSSSSGGECILATALEPAEQGVKLLLVVGSTSQLRFERLPVSSGAGGSKVTYLQPAAADGLIKTSADRIGTASTQAMQGMDVDILGPDNDGEAVQQRVAASSKSRKRQEPEPDSLAAAATPSDEAAAAAEEEAEEDLLDSGEPTLGERVAELQQQQQAATAAAGDQPGAAAAATSGAALTLGPVKADSLAVLLTQALRSSDRALLEQCLSVSDRRVVANTVKRLVPLDAALLLRAAVERLQSKPARGQQLAAWIQAVLLHHTAYLMAAPGAAPVMSSLYQIIEARLAMQRQLLSLTGRLELLLAQSGAQQGAAAAAGADVGLQVVYQESDSEAEVELVNASAGDDTDDDDDEEDKEEYSTDSDEGSKGEDEGDELESDDL